MITNKKMNKYSSYITTTQGCSGYIHTNSKAGSGNYNIGGGGAGGNYFACNDRGFYIEFEPTIIYQSTSQPDFHSRCTYSMHEHIIKEIKEQHETKTIDCDLQDSRDKIIATIALIALVVILLI
jgi:hypothetical protein